MGEKSDRYLINSVLRATQILEAYSLEKVSYTNAELSKKLGLNKSSMTRLLHTLEKAGFLERDSSTGRHSLTMKLFRIGSVYISQVNLHKEALPHLSELAFQYRETSHLAVLHDKEVFYIAKVPSSRSIRMKSLVRSKLPAYCTAIGKVLLANLEEEALEEFLQTADLKKNTPNTITDPSKLRKHLKRIKDRGYSLDNMEFGNEIKSVAAPVMDHTGKVIAGISLVAPSFRIKSAKKVERIITSVKKTAQFISERLGYIGDIEESTSYEVNIE